MSTCVNLNLKEFKDCCKRLNVSPTTLEPIVHEYINIEGNESSFPSDAYISERIHGREVSVLSDAQIKVWERKFSEPKTFNSNEEAVAYYNEARKYFPKEAIGIKETLDGKYEVRIAEPYKTTDENAYYNISPTTVEKLLKNNGLIHSYNGTLFVTRKENKTTKQLKEDIYTELELYNYSRESVKFHDKNNSILIEIVEPLRKADLVDAEVNKSMRSIKSVIDFLTEKIPAIRNKVHYDTTVEEATKILKKAGKVYHDGINSFVHNGNIYLIQGKTTQDIAIEEALHILTESLIADNRSLASEMLHEAQKLFPQLVEDIRRTYKGKDTQNREILTQALARVFRQEFNEGERQTAESILSKFVNWIKQLFGINTVTGNTIIELDQLSTDMTLRDFAQLINSSNAEFKTWSHRKTQFNKLSKEETSSTVESQQPYISKEVEERAKEIQESLGVTEEEAKELAELFDTDKTEEELKQKQQSEEKEDKVRKHLLSIDAQIKELTESNVISRSEITELAYDIVYTISDFLTQWQNDPKLVIEKFNKDEKDIEKIKTMSRKELANYIGINNIFDFIKEAYFGEIKPTDSDEIISKKEVIYDNFEAILQFGKSAFTTIEDFSIGYSEVGYSTKDKSENDNESELTNEEQTAKEELGDKQEHWQIDSRTIDNFLSMSQTVKRELLNLYELEEVVKDDISVIQPKLNAFGMKKRVSPKDATSSILRWTRGALTLKQMIVKLQEKEDKHPWVKELITKLSDDNKTGKYTDFQSQFFNVFCKHFQDYYAVTKETSKDGTTITKVIPLNLNPALKGAVDAIKILYQVRRHLLFDKPGKVDINALNTLKKYKELLEKITDKPFEEIDLDRVKTGIFKTSQLLGFSTTEEEIFKALSTNNIKTFIKNLDNIVDNLEKGAKFQNYSPFDFKGTNSISGYVREFIRPITERREDTAISSLYDSGKMYQSYVIPSWLSKTMDKFMNLEDEEYERFLMEEYGQYDWFRDTSVEDITGATAWRCPWLKRLANATLEERRKIFGHHVQLNYLGHNYMKNMSGPEYTLSVINEFFTDTTDSKESIGTAWYKIPMMSNKPSAEFIKFIRYKGLTYKNDITNELINVYIQELMRIQTVIQRGYTKNDPEFIKAFDNRGKHFLFLDYLDDYLNGSKKSQELGKLLNAKVLGKKLPDVTVTVKGETKIISGEQRLLALVKNEIKTQMDTKVASIIESYKANGIFEAAKNVQGVSKTDEELTRDLENFIWNDTFASINILQMTITDLAYYKDTEDVQKRLAQIHAPGMRPNVEATDYEGNRVCPDGMFRTVFLQDFEGKAVFELDEIIQNVIDNIEVVFQRKINVAKSNNNKTEEEYWTSTMSFIIEQLKETVNVADAQAFNCPTSYRKKALMFGKWDKKYEEVYQKLKNKEYNINDLEAAFQPLKPFVYTSTSKDSGVTNAPIKNMKVGMQFKNSEYLLIMADAILRGEDTGKPNLLRAIFDVMEESAEKHPGKGIDSIMFGSAVKAGLHGQIDIADSITEEEAKARLEVIFDSNSKDGMYNPTFVHTYPAEDYTIQQEVPAHFMDHDQAHGTQERMIIPSDLPLVDENGNEVFFEYYDYKEDKVVKKNAKEFRKVYEENIAESINQNLEELEDALGLNIVGPDAKRQRNIKLSKILQEEILSSPRYGIDLYVACSVNEKGEFNIPLGDPVQSKRVEQLINSVIKNRLNKQKIAGGPVVQVSNFGMSKRLSIKFKKEDGTILPTFKEWQAKNENGTIEDYKEMLKKEQAGIAHYECYAPAYMKEMFECFMNEKGELDVEAMEKSNPEMLEMVGYRIPSEDAYSVAPLKIVGFLPKEAGEGIVMPYEITLITGSDFDKYHC